MSRAVTSLVVICDWPLLRLGLAQAINAQPDIDIARFVESVEEVPRVPSGAEIILLVNLQSGDQATSGEVARLHRAGHAVVVLSASEPQSDAVLCIQAGARGYLGRQTGIPELLTALRAVASGSDYFGASLAGRSIPAAPPRITSREREILQLLAGGATDREIATKLNITENTVHTHLERLRKKSGCRRRADLTRLALEYGVIDTGTAK
ncbi:response regulator transcription factor [Streptomyces sp. NPDC047024]|uniref:response regulator transcription factor n=1 Tax=Streptomyces sp. NPDC047024 TaxID=3155476 RepID=UPI003411E4E6